MRCTKATLPALSHGAMHSSASCLHPMLKRNCQSTPHSLRQETRTNSYGPTKGCRRRGDPRACPLRSPSLGGGERGVKPELLVPLAPLRENKEFETDAL